MNEAPKVKVGGAVVLVTAKQRHALAKVLKVHDDGLIDLVANVNGEEVKITRSPFDGNGRTPDSWLAAGKEEEPAAATEPKPEEKK